MRNLITERELDKMEVEAEMVVSKMEEEFEKSFMGNRRSKENAARGNTAGEEYQDAGSLQQGDNIGETPSGTD